jgi:paraquat-inducible protein B
MSQTPEEEPRARVRPHRWFSWVWAVPIIAAGVVLWLAARTLVERGPAITITFNRAEGVQPGQTKIQHRNVELGTVQSMELTPDMSHVIVHARMTRAATPHLTEGAQFAIIAARVGLEGVSGLSTIISGTYIEMYPGKDGVPQRAFVGVDEPPHRAPESPGRTFSLRTDDLGSLSRGSPISYHGLSVGEVEDYSLHADGQGVSVTVSAFIRAPYDRLVHPETRFWNAGGVDLTVGTQGVRFRANSWQQLLGGGVAFETPPEVLAGAPSPSGAAFQLYDNRRAALRAPTADVLLFAADFPPNQRGVQGGTAVELEGNEVGEVKDSQLRYDPKRHTLVTRLTFAVDPERVAIMGMPDAAGKDHREAVKRWIETLVEQGLRAQVTTVSLLTGFKIVGLEMTPRQKRARVEHAGEYILIPAGKSQDFTTVLADLHEVLSNLNRATAGPELGHALQSLDQTLTRLDTITRELEPDVKSLVKSLRDAADSAQNTLNTVQALMGNAAPGGTDLPRLLRQLTEAARSVRELADYLERHPEALLRGRRGGDEQ